MEVAMVDDNLLKRIRAEYLEMPGLRLTLEQAQRLCGVERAPCQKALDALVGEEFLWVTADGHHARRTDDSIRRPYPAKADLETGFRARRAS
jgi:hypothetical protein